MPIEDQTRGPWRHEVSYLLAREREERLLSLEAIRRLPWAAAGDPDASLWKQRAETSSWVLGHLKARGARRVLDLGCGYGWLSARLAGEGGMQVVALDAIPAELERARAAFGPVPNIEWTSVDVFDEAWAPEAFDAVVLCASVQYFGSLPLLVARLSRLLRTGGEILVFDSPLWRRGEVDAARRRSQGYYASRGLPELAAAFHHHAREDLDALGAVWYYLPDTWWARVQRHLLRRRVSSFPIVGVPARPPRAAA